MPRRPLALLATMAVAVLLSACASTKKEDLAQEVFEDTTTFTRNYAAAPENVCEASRRALLSQAYIITSAAPLALTARKHFLQSRDQYYEIEFNITCVPDRSKTSTIFASAVQQLYTLRKTNTSASVGVSVLGSLSVPIGSTDDSLVKIGSITLTKPGLYNRFFTLLEDYLVADTNGQPAPATRTDTLNPSEAETALPPAASDATDPGAASAPKNSD